MLRAVLLLSCLLARALAGSYQRRIPDDIDKWDYGLVESAGLSPVSRFWSRSMLRRSAELSNVERLVGLVEKLNSGQRIVVAVLGSSICSDRGGCWHESTKALEEVVDIPGHVYQKGKCDQQNARQGFLRNFMYMINQTWPNDHILVNGARPGAGLTVFARGACLEANFPKTADLLIMEHHHAPDSGGGLELEQVLWRLHQHFESMPAVILVNSLRVVESVPEIDCMRKKQCTGSCVRTFNSVLQNQDDATQSLQAEAEFNMVASFYSLSSVSIRSWFWLAIRDQVYERFNMSVCSFYQSVLYDTIHQNHVGNVLMADMLIDLLWQAEDLMALDASSPAHRVSTVHAQRILMPKFTVYKEGDAVAATKCYGLPGESTPAMEVVQKKGWEFVEYQMHGKEKKYKPGYVATEPGSILQIKLNASSGSALGADDSYIMLGVLYLRSYEHMGMAAIRCASGCRCKEAIIEAHNNRTTTSLINYFAFRATPHPECILELEVLRQTTSGGHKFKISQVTFTGADVSAITGKPYYHASSLVQRSLSSARKAKSASKSKGIISQAKAPARMRGLLERAARRAAR